MRWESLGRVGMLAGLGSGLAWEGDLHVRCDIGDCVIGLCGFETSHVTGIV